MNEQFKTISESLIKEGFQSLTEKPGKSLDFNITPYSLNTAMSFKFENLPHFLEFLQMHNPKNVTKKTTALKATLMEIGLDPNEFFWVNFFESGKSEEM